MPQLIVSADGADIQHVPLARKRTTLGRGPDNDIVLDRPMVSTRHCVFERQGLADVVLEDQGSTNGTFVNNKRVTRHLLRDGEVIAIGNFRIRFLGAPEPEPGPGSEPGTEVGAQPPADAADAASAQAVFRMLDASANWVEVPLVKAVTTLGKPGAARVVVSRRRTGYHVARMDGDMPCLLNGAPIGADAVPLSNHDVLELAGTRMLFQVIRVTAR